MLPTDGDAEATILSFFSSSVLLPPPGEPVGVDDIRPVGSWGRESWDRPGGLDARFDLLGDHTATPFWAALAQVMPEATFQSENATIDRMQRVRSVAEQKIIRAAAQLIDIGLQAAYHEIYAAFTFAQRARGVENLRCDTPLEPLRVKL